VSELGPALRDLSVAVGFRAIGPLVPALLLLLAARLAGRAASRTRALLLAAGATRLLSASCVGTLAWSMSWLADNVSRESSHPAESGLVWVLAHGGAVEAATMVLVAAAVAMLPESARRDGAPRSG
jgi:hypothetical protein